MEVMSWADVYQIVRGLAARFAGEEKKAPPTATTTAGAADVPANTLTAAFTTVDEAKYCGNLKGLLTTKEEWAIDLLEAQMTSSHQVEQFRLMILNMANPDTTVNRMEPMLGKDGKPTGAKKAVPHTVNHAFTKKDTRVLRLQSYAAKILAGADVAAQILIAQAIVTKLLKEGSITEKSVSDIGKEKFEGAKKALADGSWDATTFVLLGDEHTAIHRTKAGATKKARRINTALDAKVLAKQAELESWGFKGVFTNKWTYAYGLLVVSGLVYIFFF